MSNRASKLIDKCKIVPAFIYEGIIYEGYIEKAVLAFVEAEPFPADFHLWLQKNYKQIN